MEYSTRMEGGAILSLLITYRYLVLLPLAILEGPLLAFLVGALVALGYFHPLGALAILVLGDLLPDCFFYTLGRFSHRSERFTRWRAKIGMDGAALEKAKGMWHDHPVRAILVTKFAYGISLVFLTLAGMLHVRPRIFFGYSIMVSIVHYAILMLLGYFLGETLASTQNIVTAVELGIGLVILASVTYYIAIHFIRKRLDS